MWEIFRRARLLAAMAAVMFALSGVGANAQDTFINQNISGFNLPGVQLPQGHDEVRAADGTTCRSAVSGSGAYLDVGVIGNPEQSTVDSSLSAYGRVVIPLGKQSQRLDCSRLYDLEVRRLEIELKLMEMGLTRGIAPISEPSLAKNEKTDDNGTGVEVAQAEEDSWADEGWSKKGLKN